jgi:hypothetical protein
MGMGLGESSPFCQVRWAYGTKYGLNGLMLIEKWNGEDNRYGRCWLHHDDYLPVMRKN